MAFTYNIQSVVHCKIHEHSTLYLSKQLSTQSKYCCLFSIWTNKKNARLSRIFSRTFQILEFFRKNPGLSRRHGDPEYATFFFTAHHSHMWYLAWTAKLHQSTSDNAASTWSSAVLQLDILNQSSGQSFHQQISVLYLTQWLDTKVYHYTASVRKCVILKVTFSKNGI